jgi:hypothetical protein
MKYYISFLFAAILFAACANQPQADASADSSEDATAEEVKAETYGETITADDAITLDQLVEQLAGKDTVEAKLAGKVSSVCQVKGCWMEMVGTDTTASPIFVKFKDYGFFMPKDLSGSEVVIRGKAYRSITTVEELKHYAEDEGLSQEEIDAITEPKEELKFMADGVVVTERS